MSHQPRKASGWKSTLLAAKTHICAQGEVIYATNVLQDTFFQLFSTALRLERADAMAFWNIHDHASALWHVVKSDRQQRELAVAAISTAPTSLKLKPAIARLKWASTKANKLAEYRNLIVHNRISFRPIRVTRGLTLIPRFGGHSTRQKHANQLTITSGGLNFWRTVRNDLLVLSAYVDDMVSKITSMESQRVRQKTIDASSPWPLRPRLRSLPVIQQIDQRLAQAPAKPKRRGRRSRPSVRATAR
jgi:hypothetical protein